MVRLGVIGRNFVVDWMLAAAEQVPEVRLSAIYSRSMEAAEAFARKYRMPHAFDRLEDLAACPEVDAVYVASPICCHFAQSKQMLEHGKHVLCEKPATTNARELETLLETAKAHGVVYLEAMRLVHDDALDLIQAHLPEIGALRRVTFEFTQYSSRYDRVRAGEQGINAFNPALSNGGLMDMGCYCVHGIARLFGRPQRVHAACVKLDNGFDGGGIVLMQYPAFVAEAVYSKISRQTAPTVLMGEDGSILLDDINHIRRIWLQPRRGEARDLGYAEKLPNNMMYELRHFCDMIQGVMDPLPWNEYSRITMEILDAARREMGIVFPAECEAGAGN